MKPRNKKYLYVIYVVVWSLIFVLLTITINNNTNLSVNKKEYNQAMKESFENAKPVSMELAKSIGEELVKESLNITDIVDLLSENPQFVTDGNKIITDPNNINNLLEKYSKKDINKSYEINFIWKVEDDYSLKATIDTITGDNGSISTVIISNENYNEKKLPVIDFKFHDFNKDNIVKNLEDKLNQFELKTITYHSNSFAKYYFMNSTSETNIVAINKDNEIIDVITADDKIVSAYQYYYEDGVFFNKTSDLKLSNIKDINELKNLTEDEFLNEFKDVKFVCYDKTSNIGNKLDTGYLLKDSNDKSYVIHFIEGIYEESIELEK